ncbi:Protein BTN1 [Leucoagaricus sp. SymC.cos]|nr:Protein BTN1 [Leucoagaricus sp. SymC.cos]
MYPTFAASAGGRELDLENDRLMADQAETSDTADVASQKNREKRLLRNLAISFFLFGLFNNVLYVIILSAALDLVPPSTPKGIIAFCNIAPGLMAKIGWPYLLKGRIRYAKRLIGCCVLSCVRQVVALFKSLSMRLLGISLASFSSGLGELTFLQLSTTYAPPAVGGHAVGYFASGTGAAGLVGAFLWWELRKFGVRIGVGVSSVQVISGLPYTPLATNEDETGEEGTLAPGPKRKIALSVEDKWHLVKPLLLKYMLPLFSVYLFEYTINQGIAPTLLYPVPSPDEHWLLSKIIHSVRDYYPFWQLVYQATVFLSRSSISLGFPALPAKLLPLPAIVQVIILFLLTIESAFGLFSEESEASNVFFVFLLISIEGICGGLAYVNVFYRLNQEHPDPDSNHDLERTKQEREFKIGSIGFADSSGILFAAILAVPTEVQLCNAQVRRGKFLCKGL